MNTGIILAGAASAEVHIPDAAFPLDGFTCVHDNIYVRVLLLEAGEKAALFTIDTTNLPETLVDCLASYITEKTATPKDHICCRL